MRLLLCLLLAAGSAEAMTCRVQIPKTFVVKPGKDAEFQALLKARQYMQMRACCVSCLIPHGTEVVVIDHGIGSHTVRVISGPHAGCVGDVDRGHLDCRR
jgi:hypothetical protein